MRMMMPKKRLSSGMAHSISPGSRRARRVQRHAVGDRLWVNFSRKISERAPGAFRGSARIRLAQARGEKTLSEELNRGDLSEIIAENFGANATYVEGLLRRYPSTPSLGDEAGRAYFAELLGEPQAAAGDGATATQGGNGAATAFGQGEETRDANAWPTNEQSQAATQATEAAQTPRQAAQPSTGATEATGATEETEATETAEATGTAEATAANGATEAVAATGAGAAVASA